MKTIRKLFAALTGILTAAGMLAAVPAAAVRSQLGTFTRIGESSLYLSDIGAIWVESRDTAGAVFAVKVPNDKADALDEWIRAELPYATIQKGDKDTKLDGTPETPVCYYSIEGRETEPGGVYREISQFYAKLRRTYPDIVSFRYYPDFGNVNGANVLGYRCEDDPEMQTNIETWIAAHYPNIMTETGIGDLLTIKLNGGDEPAVEPSAVLSPIYLELYREYGYQPVSEHGEAVGFGDQFAVDFLAEQANYDAVTEDEIEAAAKKYSIPLDAGNATVFLSLPNRSLGTLAKRVGSSYKATPDYNPYDMILVEEPWNPPPQDMVTEALGLGICEVNAEDASGFNGPLYDTGEDYYAGYLLRLDDDFYPRNPEQAGTAPDITKAAHMAAYLDKYAGVDFGIWIELPSKWVTSPPELGDVNLDSTIDVSDAVLLARFCAEDSEAVITAQGKQNADLDYDGSITGQDVITILKMIAKLI